MTVTKPPVTAALQPDVTPDVTKENGRPSLGPKAMTGAAADAPTETPPLFKADNVGRPDGGGRITSRYFYSRAAGCAVGGAGEFGS